MDIKTADIIAHQLIEKNNFYLYGWTFGFDESVRRFGYCQWNRRHISLSRKLTELNDETQVTDTILHEIAHAIAGPKSGHSYLWKHIARQIGCNAQRCYDRAIVKQPERKWECKCPHCGFTFKRFRKTNIACSDCCNKYNHGIYTETYKFTWRAI